ncbi:ribonuclease H1/H2 small subunit [Phlyctema vagabunda]|uniref:Ribonuclease H1/H2 small subunit n=1 Tax=Phlyctema vagabunda TaxID=108571 RepID=A0ABR4PRQ9_9HELO
MLAVQKSKKHQGKCVPNVLPCKINHDGPVDATKRYWAPTKTEDGKTIAYFRGRKLQGKAMRVPKGHRGVVLTSTDRIVLPDPAEEQEADEDRIEVGIMEEQSQFDEIMVWGHESAPDALTDPYVKGMEEWIGFASQIHSVEEEKNSS